MRKGGFKATVVGLGALVAVTACAGMVHGGEKPNWTDLSPSDLPAKVKGVRWQSQELTRNRNIVFGRWVVRFAPGGIFGPIEPIVRERNLGVFFNMVDLELGPLQCRNEVLGSVDCWIHLESLNVIGDDLERGSMCTVEFQRSDKPLPHRDLPRDFEIQCPGHLELE